MVKPPWSRAGLVTAIPDEAELSNKLMRRRTPPPRPPKFHPTATFPAVRWHAVPRRYPVSNRPKSDDRVGSLQSQKRSSVHVDDAKPGDDMMQKSRFLNQRKTADRTVENVSQQMLCYSRRRRKARAIALIKNIRLKNPIMSMPAGPRSPSVIMCPNQYIAKTPAGAASASHRGGKFIISTGGIANNARAISRIIMLLIIEYRPQ
ncbi:hypothetical protein C8J26_1109 [Sphingomonas aurantiaca]|uniref:Uncharacterized protein n=1 Tax=Sphingomonas aurantiaca TaxID=185949 RepID=A0A2T5GU22_9SPHN|nr:hypothetical protein C8J26_1109 [Sphingomonas aurantiaca]